jgi:hypothetical protein
MTALPERRLGTETTLTDRVRQAMRETEVETPVEAPVASATPLGADARRRHGIGPS